jgi:hypothetical protein
VVCGAYNLPDCCCCPCFTAAAAAAGCQVIDMEYVNTAMERMKEGDVKFRFVIDINKSLAL